jgi:large subunit ribosomal protein L23
MNIYKILKSPYLTEKTNEMKDSENKVTFKVDKKSNKKEIKKAVEKIFSVVVEKVSVINQGGKEKKLGRSIGKRSDWKKATVTLKKGNKIDIFEGA